MPFTIPMVGASATRRTPNQEFALGTTQLDDQNRTYVYVRSNVAVAAAAAPVMSAAFLLTAGTGGTYTADAAFAAGEYGWVRKTTSPL